jgi:hypothetical protein
LCQLKCPVCIHARGESGPLGKGYLKFKDFKKFVDTYPEFKQMELSNYGEMFLNPELSDIIKYAYEKNIRLYADNGVNMNTVSQEVLEGLVKYKFRRLTVSRPLLSWLREMRLRRGEQGCIMSSYLFLLRNNSGSSNMNLPSSRPHYLKLRR